MQNLDFGEAANLPGLGQIFKKKFYHFINPSPNKSGWVECSVVTYLQISIFAKIHHSSTLHSPPTSRRKGEELWWSCPLPSHGLNSAQIYGANFSPPTSRFVVVINRRSCWFLLLMNPKFFCTSTSHVQNVRAFVDLCTWVGLGWMGY